MNNSLLLPLIILSLIIVLFVIVSISSKRVDRKKSERLIKELFSLEKATNNDEIAIRRDAIIKLDNLLSKSLQLYFNNDLSCGENLKLADKLFRKREYNALWDVHKLRNNVVHNDYAVSKEESLKSFRIYKNSIIKILQ